MATPGVVIKKTKRRACKACIQIEGLSGDGKSGLALEIAMALAKHEGTEVGSIDTEKGSHDLFEGILNTQGELFPSMSCVELDEYTGYSPAVFLQAQNALIQAGCGAIVNDSITHAWKAEGGILAVHKNATDRQKKADTYAAWNDDEVIKAINDQIKMIRRTDAHVISTVRLKETFGYDESEGRCKLVSLGEKQIQNGDLKYEFDLVLRMITPGKNTGGFIAYPKVEVIKTRYAMFEKGKEYEFTPSLYKQLVEYLSEGADPEELLKLQKEEYIAVITDYLDNNKSKRTSWKVLKERSGMKDVPLNEIPLGKLKELFAKLMA